MAKVISKSSPNFASGGDAGKFNPQATASASKASPNKTAVSREGGGSAKFAAGGSGGFNPPGSSSAGPAKAGSTTDRSGDGGKFAKGGTHSMASNRGSVPMRAGRTTAC